jgi:hypothetical protein
VRLELKVVQKIYQVTRSNVKEKREKEGVTLWPAGESKVIIGVHRTNIYIGQDGERKYNEGRV